MSFDPKKLAGLGMDQLDESTSMPLLKLLQPRCAEVDPDHRDHDKKGITGARTGDVVFSPEALVLSRPISIIPLSIKSLYAEWKPKGQGGGLVAHHGLNIVSHPDYVKGRNPDKPYSESLGQNDLMMTMYICVLFEKSAGNWERAIIALTSTNLKHGRTMQSQIKKFRYDDPSVKPFMFSRKFTLESQKAASSEHSWYEFKITPSDILDFDKDSALLTQASEAFAEATASLPEPSAQARLTLDPDEDVF